MKPRTIRPTRRLISNTSEEGMDLMTRLRNRQDVDKMKDSKQTPTRPMLYTIRKNGVPIEGNPKSDNWDIAQGAKDYIARTKEARRNQYDNSGGAGGIDGKPNEGGAQGTVAQG